MADATIEADKLFHPRRTVRSLADQVYAYLRTAIISEQLAPGARIVELEIANTMGTSQGPVREALQRLEREGLVTKQSHSATFVTTVSIDEMYELFSIRSVIEGFAIRRTVARVTSQQCDQLQELVEAMRTAGQRDDMLELTEHDLQFHRLICQWSGSATLQRAWDPLYGQTQRFVVRTHKRYFASLTDIADTHLPIIVALRAHDEANVSRLIHEHVMLIWSMFGQEEKKEFL
ncbi:MAG: GntR family transcriptional regulator [Caldilineaceae bacterium]|nr:GntR family transcriptional regulator [Caldilineaceae bacterium]